MSRLRPLLVFIAALASGCTPSGKPIAIHGDSTAIASRIPLSEKFWNLVPHWDQQRWWNLLAGSYQPPRPVFNDGVGGQTITLLREKMEHDPSHRQDMTIIYDRRNDGEDAAFYLKNLTRALHTLRTTHFLIMPQVPRALGESREMLAAMAAINKGVARLWPQNTFNDAEKNSFLAALANPDTRVDGLHRNGKGQAIEARYIKAWLDARGW